MFADDRESDSDREGFTADMSYVVGGAKGQRKQHGMTIPMVKDAVSLLTVI